MIEGKNIKKTFPGAVPVHALKGIDIAIKTGEFVAIMGRSGSGKSTLLHQLSLLDVPTAGEIIVDNQDILKLSERQKTLFRLTHFGYVFQTYALLPEFTALETVSIPLMMAGVSHGDYTKKAKEILELVGLGHRLNHRPFELSGGEQQRVAIARALVHNPKIVFADEPCANLDVGASTLIMQLFAKLNKDLGQTIVLVTHEPDDEKYVDRVITLDDGLIKKGDGVQLGKTLE
ncbi:MAG TPA: ABC transporter ATP-binding protein [bacterium]|nr:ABC transporter ATP-binding protein [bacterium]